MSGFHKAVCLAAMVALAVPSLQTRGEDPLVPEPLGALKLLPNQIVELNAGNGVVILNMTVNGRVLLVDGRPVMAAAEFSDRSAEDLFPIVGEGFASDRAISGSLAPLVKSLHADSYAERARASQQLMRLPPDRLPDIVAALAKETDPEAISRLENVAGHLFLKPRTNVKGSGGFLDIGGTGEYVSMLGMKFDDPDHLRLPDRDENAVGVRVAELQPGFPAAQDLRTGDCILAIDGKAFPEDMVAVEAPLDASLQDSFMIESANRERKDLAKRSVQERIRAVRPGGVATFTILREGKVLDIPVQLAAMPAKNRDSLSALVELRNQMMKDFVGSIKTGERQQAKASPTESPRGINAEFIPNGMPVDEFRIYRVNLP